MPLSPPADTVADLVAGFRKIKSIAELKRHIEGNRQAITLILHAAFRPDERITSKQIVALLRRHEYLPDGIVAQDLAQMVVTHRRAQQAGSGGQDSRNVVRYGLR